MQAADAYADMAEDDLEALPARPEPEQRAALRAALVARRLRGVSMIRCP